MYPSPASSEHVRARNSQPAGPAEFSLESALPDDVSERVRAEIAREQRAASAWPAPWLFAVPVCELVAIAFVRGGVGSSAALCGRFLHAGLRHLKQLPRGVIAGSHEGNMTAVMRALSTPLPAADVLYLLSTTAALMAVVGIAALALERSHG